MAYVTSRKLEKAVRLFQDVLHKREALLGPTHPHTLVTAHNLAAAYLDLARVDDAIALFERVLAGRREKLPPDHPDTLVTLNALATAYKDKGRFPESVALYEQVLAARKARLKPDHADVTRVIRALALAHVAAEQFDRAEPLLREVRARQEKSDPEAAMQTLATLGYVLMRESKFVEAEPTLRECLAKRWENQPDEWVTFNIQTHVGAALLGQQKYPDAESFLVQGYEGLKQRASKISPRVRTARLTEALEHVVRLYSAWNKPDEAAKWRRELDELKGTPQAPKSDKPS
jgi:tetratricopeptide (TPR) repeat protein